LQPSDLLGVSPGAGPAEVSDAFRRFALRHHPDRGGDPATFQAGVDAYRRLSGRHRAPANVTFYRRRRASFPSLLRAAVRRFHP
jgi:curved DNA-binding protein CbpA